MAHRHHDRMNLTINRMTSLDFSSSPMMAFLLSSNDRDTLCQQQRCKVKNDNSFPKSFYSHYAAYERQAFYNSGFSTQRSTMRWIVFLAAARIWEHAYFISRPMIGRVVFSASRVLSMPKVSSTVPYLEAPAWHQMAFFASSS